MDEEGFSSNGNDVSTSVEDRKVHGVVREKLVDQNRRFILGNKG